MIFWISVLVAVVVALLFIYTDEAGVIGSVFCGAIAGTLLLMIAGAIVVGITATLKPTIASTAPLKALATSKSVSGTFFLGSGSINGKRTINYITADGNRNYVREADASTAVVIEDSPTSPSIVELKECADNPWVMPWTFCRGIEGVKTEFHVPAGSVLSDYTVDNK
jgi:hypothetical protein